MLAAEQTLRDCTDAGEWAISELGYVLGPVLGTGRTIDAWR